MAWVNNTAKNSLIACFLLVFLGSAVAIGVGLAAPAPRETGLDYSSLELPNIDAQGFSYIKAGELELDYRITIEYGENPPLYGFGPFAQEARGFLEIRNLNRPAELTGFINQKIDPSFFDAGFSANYYCLLGHCMVPLKATGFVKVDGLPLQKFFAKIPEGAAFTIFRDSGNPGGIFRLNENSAFYFAPSIPTAVYALPGQLVFSSILFLLASIFFALVYMKGKPKLKPIVFSQKKAFVFALLCLVLMAQLSALAPAKQLTVSFDLATSKAFAGKGVVDGESLPIYLWFSLAQTGAISQVIVGETGKCPEKGGFDRHWFLSGKSAKEILVLREGFSCGKDFPELLSGKGALVSRALLGEKIEASAQKEQPIIGVLHKIIFVLSAISLFFIALGLILSALELVSGKKWKYFIAWLFLALILLPALTLAGGWLAHKPVTYHGASSLPLTMGQGLVPGLLNQGHSLRLGLAFLGGLVALFFSAQARKYANPKTLIGLLAVFSLLLVIPPIALEAKKLYLGFECANCFNESTDQSIFAFKGETPGPYSAFFAEIDLLRYQKKREQAIARLEEFIVQQRNSPAEGTAHHILGNLLWEKGEAEEAIPHYDAVAKRFPGEFYRKASLFKLGDYFMRKGDHGKAANYYEMMSKDYPGTPYAEHAEKMIARMNEKGQGESQ